MYIVYRQVSIGAPVGKQELIKFSKVYFFQIDTSPNKNLGFDSLLWLVSKSGKQKAVSSSIEIRVLFGKSLL